MASTKAAAVRVEGLTELRSALKRLENLEDQAELKQALWDAAGRVVDEARAKASTRQERSMASRLKASRSQAKAAVIIGGKPFDLGAEFGAKAWPQFRDWLGNDMNAGYLLFPTIREQTPQIVEDLGDVVEKIFREDKSVAAAGKLMESLEAAVGGRRG